MLFGAVARRQWIGRSAPVLQGGLCSRCHAPDTQKGLGGSWCITPEHAVLKMGDMDPAWMRPCYWSVDVMVTQTRSFVTVWSKEGGNRNKKAYE
jgi:hypothetical protein